MIGCLIVAHPTFEKKLSWLSLKSLRYLAGAICHGTMAPFCTERCIWPSLAHPSRVNIEVTASHSKYQRFQMGTLEYNTSSASLCRTKIGSYHFNYNEPRLRVVGNGLNWLYKIPSHHKISPTNRVAECHITSLLFM